MSDPHYPILAFEEERRLRCAGYASDAAWHKLSAEWMIQAFQKRYMYNFEWMGRPIIQTPVDMFALQEIVWSVKPDLIIETGIAHGGSLVFHASLLALLDACDTVQPSSTASPRRRVLGIDIDIRAHNRAAIEAHPLSRYIEMIEGSSIDPQIIARVEQFSSDDTRILVCLDSNHTHDHVLAELEAYAPLASPSSYCVVFDTVVEDLPEDMFPDRPWGKGNNPKTAVHEYLRRLTEEGRTDRAGRTLHFERDKALENKLLLTLAPEGYLKRVG